MSNFMDLVQILRMKNIMEGLSDYRSSEGKTVKIKISGKN